MAARITRHDERFATTVAATIWLFRWRTHEAERQDRSQRETKTDDITYG
jgi:hypothetical protein